MRSLFTLFELLKWGGRVLGLVAGCIIGHRIFGLAGLVGGGVLGLMIGGYLGNLPGNRSIVAIHRSFMNKSDEDLRAELRRADCNLPNFILLELDRRGADTSSELPMVLDMLEDPDPGRRRRGVAALTSAFPEVANHAQDYRPTDPADECRRKVCVLRDIAEQSPAGDSPKVVPKEDVRGEHRGMSTSILKACPHCSAPFGKGVVGQQWTSVGPASVTCPNCGGVVVTGQSEWADKDSAQRARYIGEILATCTIAIVVVGPVGGIVISVIGNLITGIWKLGEPVAGLIDGWLFPAVPLSLAALIKVMWLARREIRSSVARTSAKI